MNLRWLISVTVAVAAIWPANAAIASFFSLPDIDIRVRFENLDEYPNYDFYLKYGLGKGNPYASLHLTKVQANTLIQLEGKGGRITNVFLMAVPRGQAADPPTREGNWLQNPQPGALQSESIQGDPTQLIGAKDYNGHEIDYRVRIQGNRLDVIWLKSKTPWLPRDEAGRMTLFGSVLAIAAFFVAASIVVWRWRKRATLPAAKADQREGS